MQESGEQTETMSSKDAAMFPLMASATLFGLYVFFQVTRFSSLLSYIRLYILQCNCCSFFVNVELRHYIFWQNIATLNTAEVGYVEGPGTSVKISFSILY